MKLSRTALSAFFGVGLLLSFLPQVACVTEEELQKIYCCHLSREELDAMRGVHPSCPTQSYGIIEGTGSSGKCDSCPPGTCRMRSASQWIDQGCICAGDFIGVAATQADYTSWGRGHANREGCWTNYGARWPDSQGVTNLNLRSCDIDTIAPTSSPTCGKQCVHGTFEPETCSCLCPVEFRGETCDQCSQYYYGNLCETYCKESETCAGAGVCSDDGRMCVCNAGKYGSDCTCDAQNCSMGSSACSGQGTCTNSECTCNNGFVGCSCELECNEATTCSGNGSCRPDATCQCKPGFVGSDCATLDLSTYCSGKTVSGNPCLPGVIHTLGYGYDAVRGSTTIPVALLSFTEGRTISVEETTYEIPDNVVCKPVTRSESGFSTSVFRSSIDFRRHLARSLGLAGEFQAAQNSAYLSASKEYENVYERSFSQERGLFTSELESGIYSCKLDIGSVEDITPTSKQALESLTGDRMVKGIGTHYIKEAIFGGKLSVFSFVESCVFASETTKSIRTQIDASIFGLAGDASVEGTFDTMSSSEDGCSVFERNSFYLKSVLGGNLHWPVLPGASSLADFQQWFDSILDLPSPIKLELEHIDLLVPEVTPQLVEKYVEKRDPLEATVEADSEACDLPVACTVSESGGTKSNIFTAALVVWFYTLLQ